jgi:hypothetical protein
MTQQSVRHAFSLIENATLCKKYHRIGMGSEVANVTLIQKENKSLEHHSHEYARLRYPSELPCELT